MKTGTECLAWSLLGNHVHLLLRPRKALLATFMRRLLTGYAIYFNLRHKRSGHLYQNRFKSIVCEEDAYLLELVRYIHLNPLRAGLVKDLGDLDKYPWSGHAALMGEGDLEGQVTDEILSLFSRKKREARERYRQFVADGISLGEQEKLGSGRRIGKEPLVDQEGGPYDARILGSGAFVEEMQIRHDQDSEINRPMAIGEIVARVCAHFELNPEELLLKTRTPRIAAIRSIICYLAVRRVGHSGVDVGRLVNVRRAAVSIAAGRGEKIVKGEPILLDILNY